MATRAELISDIHLRIYQGKPSDDIELEATQIAHWLDITRDQILMEKFNRELLNDLSINGFYIFREECLQLTREPSDCREDCVDPRYFITLSYDVIPLYKDGGIVRIVDNYGRSLTGTDQLFSESLMNLPYHGTSNGRQTFYRENNGENRNVYIADNSDQSVELYSYNVFYIRQVAGSNLSDDSEYPLEGALLPELLNMVEEIARREMNLGISDQENDGTDPYNNKN